MTEERLLHEHPELVAKRARYIAWTRAGVATLVGFLVICLTIITGNAILSFSSRKALLDCTQSDGKCYQEGQKRTGAAVSSIVGQTVHKTIESAIPLHRDTRHYAELAAYCADKPGSQTIQEINTCILDRLQAEQKRK